LALVGAMFAAPSFRTTYARARDVCFSGPNASPKNTGIGHLGVNNINALKWRQKSQFDATVCVVDRARGVDTGLRGDPNADGPLP
jgi:hypothetical protein